MIISKRTGIVLVSFSVYCLGLAQKEEETRITQYSLSPFPCEINLIPSYIPNQEDLSSTLTLLNLCNIFQKENKMNFLGNQTRHPTSRSNWGHEETSVIPEKRSSCAMVLLSLFAFCVFLTFISTYLQDIMISLILDTYKYHI